MTDYGRPLSFGAFLTPAADDPDRVVELAQHAERSGLDLLTFQDHPYQPAYLDTWTLLSYVAARTTSIRLSGNVLNLPLRQPAVLARSVASLDRLSGGRVELGLGAGAFWEAIEAMGGTRRSPGEAVSALSEAIDIIRALWDTESRGGVRVDGEHYRVHGAKRGPAPAHPVGIWLGAYRPRMLRLVGRVADGWLPSLGYLGQGELARGQAAIDESARAAGRRPDAIRRLLNVSPDQLGSTGSTGSGSTGADVAGWAERLAGYALDGIDTFILATDDPQTIDLWAAEVAPWVRELVAAERAGSVSLASVSLASVSLASDPGSGSGRPRTEPPGARTVSPPVSEDRRDRANEAAQWSRLGLQPAPAPDPLTEDRLWDESARPRRQPSRDDVAYTARGRAVGEHLIEVHDSLRSELSAVRDVLDQVRQGTTEAATARSVINDLTMRQNDWTLGAYCASYCRIVTGHHSLEDASIFPHLRAAEDELAPVIDRLAEEHVVIHDVLERLDRQLVAFIAHPDDFTGLQHALDLLTDTLLSHLAYEEDQLVEPLARLGFYAGQL